MSHDPSRQATPVTIAEVLGLLPAAPVATTRDRGWGGVTVDLYGVIPDCSVRYSAFDHHVICYCTSGRARMVQGREGVLHENFTSAGMSLLMPAGSDSLWEGDIAASTRMRIPTALVAAAAEQLGRRAASQFEIRNVFETRDPMIEHIAITLAIELDRAAHPAQRLVIEAMSCTLAAHMLRSYNVFDVAGPPAHSKLGHAELAQINDFIEDHVHRQISLAELAALVNVSRFHFTRLFRRSTGMTVSAFVEQCRIRRARALLDAGIAPLAEVALMTGFADQSHFTRRFKRLTGSTPGLYARVHGPGRRKRAD